MTERYVPDQENDVLSAIDELVNESLDSYDRRTGYDYNAGDDSCPNCYRNWHGLPKGQCPGSHLKDAEYDAALAELMVNGPQEPKKAEPDGSPLIAAPASESFASETYRYDSDMLDVRTRFEPVEHSNVAGIEVTMDRQNGTHVRHGERFLTPHQAMNYARLDSIMEAFRANISPTEIFTPPLPEPELLDASAGAVSVSVYCERGVGLTPELIGASFSSMQLMRHVQQRTQAVYYTASVDFCDLPEDAVQRWMDDCGTARWMVFEHESFAGEQWIRIDTYDRRPEWDCSVRVGGSQLYPFATNALSGSHSTFEAIDLIQPSPPVPFDENHPHWCYRTRNTSEALPQPHEVDFRVSTSTRNAYRFSPETERALVEYRARREQEEAERRRRYRELIQQASLYISGPADLPTVRLYDEAWNYTRGMYQFLPGTFGQRYGSMVWRQPPPCEKIVPTNRATKLKVSDSLEVRRGTYRAMMDNLAFSHDFETGKMLNIGELVQPAIARNRDDLPSHWNTGRGYGRTLQHARFLVMHETVRNFCEAARSVMVSLETIKKAMDGIADVFTEMERRRTAVPFWANNPTKTKRPKKSKSGTRRKYGRR